MSLCWHTEILSNAPAANKVEASITILFVDNEKSK